MIFTDNFFVINNLFKQYYSINKEGDFMEKVKNYTFSILLGYILLFFMFLITSCIFAYTNIQDKFLNFGIYISLFLACFISSLILGKKMKKKAMVNGSIFGILIYALIFVCGGILSGFTFNITTLIYFAISIISSIIGCIIGVSM